MRFILAVVIGFALMAAHQSTAPPRSHDSILTNAIPTSTPALVSMAKVLNLDSIVGINQPAMRVEELIVAECDFGTMPSEAVPSTRGGAFGSTLSYAFPVYTTRGEACADVRAPFEDA